MQNLEFKAELRDLPLARGACRAADARPVGTLTQTDTFFRIPTGRLKKRETSIDGVPDPVEYIEYMRDNRAGPRVSRFTIRAEDEFRERFGLEDPPTDVVVSKTREVWMLDRARVHLDQVQGLGDFIEFEILITKECNMARAHHLMINLRNRFGPCLGEPISSSYADLLRESSA